MPPERLLAEVLPQHYARTTFTPGEIHLPFPIEGADALSTWLGERKARRVYVRMPSRGPKAHRVSVAMRNARLAHRRRFRGQAEHLAAIEALQEHLGLGDLPQRIEGFDISHFQGGETVASLVVWEAGRLQKGDYRSFNLKAAGPSDDFAAMREAVGRRYRRVLEEIGAMPDLILIDGGRGQLNAGLAALAELGVEETPIVGLAKREEEIYLPAHPEPLALARHDTGLRLLMQVRDEAHRFAVDRHRRRRKKRTLTSRLDAIPGIGPKRRRALLRRFGSVAAVSRASAEELGTVLGPATSQRVFAHLSSVSGAPEGMIPESDG